MEVKMAHFWIFHFKPDFVLAERKKLNTLSYLLNYNDIETFFFPDKGTGGAGDYRNSEEPNILSWNSFPSVCFKH